MSSRIAVRRIGFTLILLLVPSAQAVGYELHRHDAIPANRNDNVILTSRDYLEQLNLVAPKASYTLQEATEHLLHFGALLRARVLDTFGSLLYDYYDDFSIAEVEALHMVYGEILERRYNIFDLVPVVLRNQDTRPSRICAEMYKHVKKPCLRSSASVCRRIRKQHDLPHPDDRNTSALNVTYQVYRLSKMSKHYPRGFSLATLLRLLQREVLTITPNLLSGLIYNVRYESYDGDVRLAERELIHHFHEISGTNEVLEISVSTKELKKFHTMNSFLKYYIDMYAEKLPDNDLKRYTLLIARSITNVGTINENIHLLGNVYENGTIHVGYLFDLVLSDDLLEKDVIEAKKYLVTKMKKFNVVEKYLRVQRYLQATPAQLTMEITEQLIDIDFIKSIAMSLRMHARFWHRSRMIESLDELLELFDTYENLREVPRHQHMMQKIDKLKKSLRDMKDIPVEILCNAPRACLRIGLQLILHCKFINSQIKDSIKDFLESSDVCVDLVYLLQESRRSVEIPFKISKVRFNTLQTPGTVISEVTTRHSPILERDQSESESKEITESAESNESTKEVSKSSEISSEESLESTSTTTTTTTPRTTESMEISTTHREETTAAITSTTAATTTTTLPATITPSPTTTATLPTTTTILPTTELTTTTTTLPMRTTASPTTTTTVSSTTTTTTLPTTTTTLPTTITTTLSTTTSTLPTTLVTTTTTSPTVTTQQPSVKTDVKIEWERTVTKVTKGDVLYHNDEDSKSSENSTVFITTPIPVKSCESDECISEESSEETTERVETTALLSTTPTMQTSTLETIRATSSELSTIHQDFVTDETTVSSTTELSGTPVTKGDNCAKSCLEGCRSKSESAETSEKSCGTSCNSVTEVCNGEDSISKDSPECGTEIDGNCGCATKQERSSECVTLCPLDYAESSSCEGDDCTLSAVSTVGMKLERKRTHSMCEIRDPHHRRQLRRLAKMRAISAVATSRVDVRRPRTSRYRDRIATKKLYNLLATRLPYSENKKVTEYLQKKSPGGRLNDKDRKHRKQQREESYTLRKQLAIKQTRKTVTHRKKGSTSLRHSQIKRRDAKSISA